MNLIKGATLFFLGASCVLFITKAFEITPITRNAVQYIQSIFLTSDGYSTSTGTIELNGADGSAHFAGDVNISGDTTIDGTATFSDLNTVGTGTFIAICIGDPLSITPDCKTAWPAPGGSTAAVQFNDGGSLSGTDTFVWDSVNGRLGIGTGSPTASLQVVGDVLFGTNNTMAGSYGSILGGMDNIIFGHNYAVIIGGYGNMIDAGPLTPSYETIINGESNEIHNASYSLIAGGKSALISGNQGVFLRSDSQTTNFTAEKDDTFIIKATNGVGIGTANPTAALEVDGGVKPASILLADPCTGTGTGLYPEGTIFYNSEDGFPCYCDPAGTAKKMDGTTACEFGLPI